MKRIGRFFICTLALFVLIGALPCLAYTNASAWAEPELKRAEELRLLPEGLLAADQSRPISRLMYSELAVRLWETIAGAEAPLAAEGIFSDCTELSVRKAAALGIVNGVAPGIFAPNQPIERQQMAVMLSRTLGALSWFPTGAGAAAFQDDREIASYAKEAVYRMRALEILNGDGQNRVSPLGSITYEQAAALTLRAYLTVTGADAAESARLKISGYTAWLSMSDSKLRAVFGQPDETHDTGRGTVWYVYGTKTYEALFLAGVKDGKVTALFATAGKFSYLGRACGARAAVSLPESKSVATAYAGQPGYTATEYYDGEDSGALASVFLLENGSGSEMSAACVLPDFGKMSMHLVNAFRIYNGKPALQWSEQAALVAQRHSADMAARMSVGHLGSNGSTLAGRMTEGGIVWSSVGENVGSEPRGDLLTLHHSWINSPAYRANLLNDNFTQFGASGTFNDVYYFTQEFFSPAVS